MKIFIFIAFIRACLLFSVSQGSKEYAIVTMISSPDYTQMGNVLQFSIKKNMKRSLLEKIDFIALIIQEHRDNKLITDRLIGWTTKYVNRIDPGIPGSVTFYRFQEQFTKLHIFNMVQYQRILYLDTDVLVVGDISPLLLDVNTSFAAVKDWESGRIQDHINCGVFSISPNATEFQRLNSLRVHKSDYRLHMAEQGLLNSVYSSENVIQYFPFAFNGNLAALVQDRDFWMKEEPNLRVIHYTWIKPGHKDRVKHTDYKKCEGPMQLWDHYLENLRKKKLFKNKNGWLSSFM